MCVCAYCMKGQTGIETPWLHPIGQSWSFSQEIMFPSDGTILIVSKFSEFLWIRKAVISQNILSPRRNIENGLLLATSDWHQR